MAEFKLSKLKYNKKNPRTIDADSLSRLKDKLNEFPKFLEKRPIVYDPVTMEVLGGNQRLKGLRELGYKYVPETWVSSADNFTEEEKKAFVVIDNHSDGNWEYDILSKNWDEEDLENWGIDLPEFVEDEEIPNMKDILESDVRNKEKIECVCPKCGFSWLR